MKTRDVEISRKLTIPHTPQNKKAMNDAATHLNEMIASLEEQEKCSVRILIQFLVENLSHPQRNEGRKQPHHSTLIRRANKLFRQQYQDKLFPSSFPQSTQEFFLISVPHTGYCVRYTIATDPILFFTQRK